MTTVLTSRSASRMRAHARLHTELAPDGSGRHRTRLAVLRSQAPLVLRPTITGRNPWATYAPDAVHVSRAAGAAGPIGGDELELNVVVGAGTTLVLTDASATLLLPGPAGERSSTRVRVHIHEDATLIWLPQPVIAARACHHVQDIAVEMAASSRLVMREELLLGRRGEAPGSLVQRVRVRREENPLHAQDLSLDDGPGSPAVFGTHRAIGSMLVVDPDLLPVAASLLGEDGALLPLADDRAALAQALSCDSIGLRRQLDAALTALVPLWSPLASHSVSPIPALEAR